MATSSPWGSGPKGAVAAAMAKPKVVVVVALVSNVKYIPRQCAGFEQYDAPGEGKVSISVAKVDHAHDLIDHITYYTLPKESPAVYPHITIKHKYAGDLVAIHISASRGASLWWNKDTTVLTGSSKYWSLSASDRMETAASFAAFLRTAGIVGMATQLQLGQQPNAPLV